MANYKKISKNLIEIQIDLKEYEKKLKGGKINGKKI